jgi:hypothetical protein
MDADVLARFTRNPRDADELKKLERCETPTRRLLRK